tara:strand:- start:5 stop:427 length:423 start_codon:yes stop_codon:yes gene_type:complete
MNKKDIIKVLSKVFDLELSGVIRYTHYSLMIFGPNRLPLIDFFKAQASESLMHATLAGEHITGLGGHPPLNIKDIKETFKHDIDEILKETLAHEQEAIRVYYELLELVQDNSVYLEEYARSMIGQEELHVLEVEKMLKNN